MSTRKLFAHQHYARLSELVFRSISFLSRLEYLRKANANAPRQQSWGSGAYREAQAGACATLVTTSQSSRTPGLSRFKHPIRQQNEFSQLLRLRGIR